MLRNLRSSVEKQPKIGSTNFLWLWFSRSLVRTKCDYSLLAMQPSRGFPRSAPTDPNSGPEASCSLAALLWISVRDLATPSPHAYSKHQHLQHTHRAFLSHRFIITCVRPVTSPLRWQKGHSASLGTELVYPCRMLHLHNEKLKLLPSRICNCRPDGHLLPSTWTSLTGAGEAESAQASWTPLHKLHALLFLLLHTEAKLSLLCNAHIKGKPVWLVLLQQGTCLSKASFIPKYATPCRQGLESP